MRFGLRATYLLGVSAITLAGFSGLIEQAQAQPVEEDEIIVTGTRRSDRSVDQSNVPVDVLLSEELETGAGGDTNTLLRTLLPSFNYPQPSITDGTDHVSPAQLRGLAPDHTLVLINGKRRHKSAMLNLNGSVGRGSSAVDLSLIPAIAIKRIEVLRDGAAAQYGSDAIAGVINIELKDGSDGGEVGASYGQYFSRSDGVENLESVSIDSAGNLSFTTGKDRKREDGEKINLYGNIGIPLGNDDGFVNISASWTTRDGTNRSDYDPRENYARINGALDPRELTVNRYNHRFGLSEMDIATLVVNAGYDLDAQTELYAFATYGQKEGNSGGFYRRARDSRNVLEIYPDGFLPQITSDIEDFSVITGVKGVVSGWDYDVSATYGNNKFNFGVVNSLNASLGPESQTTFDDGDVIASQLTLNADIVKQVSFQSLEPVVAMGIEYRNDGYEIRAGEEASYVRGPFAAPAGAQVLPGFSPAAAGENTRSSYAAYLEVDTDLSDYFNVAVAGRYEYFTDFGSTLNGKISLRYVLNDRISLRGSLSTGFRAPSLAQQYFRSIATVFINGVPFETGTFAPDSNVARALGSPGLDAEKSVSYSVGAVIDVLDGLKVTIDYFNIDIDDRIVLSSNLSGTGVESLLPTGVNRARFFLNGIDSSTKGVDVVASYRLDLEEMGDLNLTLGYNYVKNEVTSVIAPPAALASVGVDQDNLFTFNEFRRFEKGSPRDKINLSASWNLDGFNTVLRATRYGKTIDVNANPAKDELIDAEWITDLEVSYTFDGRYSIAIGAENLFDTYPEPTRESIDANLLTTFDRIFPYSGFSPYGFNGRFLYAKVKIVF